MRLRICFALISVAFSIPFDCRADGLFFWSLKPMGSEAQPTEAIQHSASGPDTLYPVTINLYYRPDGQDIRDGFSFEIEFPYYEILDAEILNFPITYSGIQIGWRWENIGEVTIDGNILRGFAAENETQYGIRVEHANNNPLFDEGYDETAQAFFIGSVTLKGVHTEIKYLSSFVSDFGFEIFPEFIESKISLTACVLDPPYGGFNQSYLLNLDGTPVAGDYHCTSEQFSTCDGTVWNRLEPTASGMYSFNTFGSTVVDTNLEVYKGNTVNSLQQIAFSDDVAGTTWSRVSFPVEPDEVYSVRIVSPDLEYSPTRLAYEFFESAIPGDLNADGLVNLLDVAPFVDRLNSSQYDPPADINADGEVNLIDVGPFVELLAD